MVQSGDVAIGEAIAGLGADVYKIGLNEQRKADEARLDALTTEYKRRRLELDRDYKSKHSGEVVESDEDESFMSHYTEEHDRLREEILGKAPNARVGNLLSRRLDMGEINFKEGLINHAEREGKIYRQQVYEGKIATSKSFMAANADDDALLVQERNDIEAATEQFLTDNGITDKDARDAVLLDNLTDAHLGVIQNRIDSGDVAGAKAYFEAYNGSDGSPNEIAGDKHDEVLRALKAADTETASVRITDEAFSRHPDNEKEGLAWARTHADPEDRDAVLRRLKARYAENRRFEAEAMEQAGIAARQIYAEHFELGWSPQEAYDEIPMSVKMAMDPSELMALQDRVERAYADKPVKTDIEAYIELEEFIREYPEAARDLDLSKFETVISTTDLKTLNALRNKDAKILGTENQLLKEGLVNIGINPSELLKDSSDGKKARAFQKWVRRGCAVEY